MQLKHILYSSCELCTLRNSVTLKHIDNDQFQFCVEKSQM